MNNSCPPGETITFFFFFKSQGFTALDTLHQWQRMYSRELDHEAREACITTERLLRKALTGGGEAFVVSQ